MLQLSERREAKREQQPRVETNLLGRYMLADRREFPCTVGDVALHEIAITGPVRGEIGETVIVYIDRLGRVEGEIDRFREGGFMLKLTIPARATEKLAQRLDELQANNAPSRFPERRREVRIEPNDKVALFGPPEGPVSACDVINLSLHGAEVKVYQRPPVGALVKLGQLHGKVVRHSESGVAIEFVDVTDDATLSNRLMEIALLRHC